MNRAKSLLVLGCMLGSAGCATIGRGLAGTVDWVVELAFNSVELGLGIVSLPFDQGQTIRSGLGDLRLTVVRPLTAMSESLDPRDRVRLYVIYRQDDDSVAVAASDFEDGKLKIRRYTAWEMKKAAPAAEPAAVPAGEQPTVLRPVFVGPPNARTEVIDNPSDKLSLQEVQTVIDPPPTLKPAPLTDGAIEFFRQMNTPEPKSF